LRKEKSYDWAAAVETILCGACWPPSRKAAAGLLPQSENVCSVCGHEGADELHQFWECPGLASSDWPEVSGSQALVPMAINEASTFPCLWFRGMLPASLCCSAPIPPPTELLDLHLFDPHGLSPNPLVWPPGLYGTDGAGGEFSSIPELRRVGCGIARMSELDGGGGFELIWAANFPLPGAVQTVPRCELFAIVVLLEHVSHGVVTVCSDSLVNVKIFEKGLLFASATTNGDLWRRIESAISSKRLEFRLHWVQGHLDTVAPVCDFPEIYVAANLAADIFADKAASRCQLAPSSSSQVLFRTKLVKRIQLRLARIVISHVEKIFMIRRPLFPKRNKLP